MIVLMILMTSLVIPFNIIAMIKSDNKYIKALNAFAIGLWVYNVLSLLERL